MGNNQATFLGGEHGQNGTKASSLFTAGDQFLGGWLIINLEVQEAMLTLVITRTQVGI
jgi:hypothetical protein